MLMPGKNKTDGDQFWFAHFFHQAAGCAALDESADDAAIGEEADNGRRRVSTGSDVQMEIVADEQGQGAFEATETKGGEEKDNDEQPDPGRAQRVQPLVEMRTLGDGLGRGLEALGQDEPGEQKISRAKGGGRPSWPRGAEQFQADAAQNRTKNESQPEGHPDKSHAARALIRRRDVGDVSLGDGDVAAAHARQKARQHHETQGSAMIGQAGGAGKKNVRGRRSRRA